MFVVTGSLLPGTILEGFVPKNLNLNHNVRQLYQEVERN